MLTEAPRSLRLVSAGLPAVPGPEAPEACTAAMGRFSELRRWLLGVSVGSGPGGCRAWPPPHLRAGIPQWAESGVPTAQAHFPGSGGTWSARGQMGQFQGERGP